MLLDPAAIAPERLRPLRCREFDHLALTGAFDEERVELLYGQLVRIDPTDPSEDASVTKLAEGLITRLGERAAVRVRCSFAASDDSEPLPDIVVSPREVYWHEHPRRAHLVVEIARTSLRKDRTVKATLYGSVAVEEYWIVDIEGGCVHVLREADGAGVWRSRQLARRGETLAPLAFPDVAIEITRILPPT